MIARIIVSLICGGFSAMMLCVGLTQLVRQRRNRTNAERIDAVIVASSISISKSADTGNRVGFSNITTSHSPEVHFMYVVGGMQYESRRLYASIIERSYALATAAAEILDSFPLRATVRAYVDRSHPDQAFLRADESDGPLVLIVLWIVMLPVAWGPCRVV